MSPRILIRRPELACDVPYVAFIYKHVFLEHGEHGSVKPRSRYSSSFEEPPSEGIVFSECPLVNVLGVVEREVREVHIGHDASCVQRVFEYVRVLPGDRV
jgi:hypothetical protein